MDTEINVIVANNFKSTENRCKELLSKLTNKEQKMFKEFLKSVVSV
ncbi:MAG: hypothetical protein RR623_01145 [Bacilli bacterium]